MSASPILEVSGLTSRAPDGTSLLDDISFAVEPGWLVAVVGPTGAGKTSLAKALLGQLPLTEGTVRVRARGRAGRVAGVPQEDATHPQLSLRRTLDHAAALRVEASAGERRRTVDAVLAELGLTGRAGTRLADLSGGERKRANVAVELVGQPDLLVLDEPTSGLDPSFEKSVFESLRSLADTGRTIVAITHSVRVLAVCDRVLFLAPGGTVAFFGTPSDARAYFDWDDPVDAYAALSTVPAETWRTRFATFQARRGPAAAAPVPRQWSRPAPAWARPGPEVSDDQAAEAAASRSGHLRTLLRRAAHLASSDRRTLVLTLVAGPVLGLLLWAVLPGGTLQAPTGAEGESLTSAPKAATFAFFLAMTITWLGAAGAAREVVKERHILRRELGAGVSVATYVTGKAVFLSALTALQVLPLALIAVIHQRAPGSGPALGSALVEVLTVALLVGVAAVSTGLLVSSWASSSEKAMTALPIVLIAQLALSGPWAEGRGPVIDLLRHLVPAKWAAGAVSATVLGDASAWWLAVLAITVIVAVQLVAAHALLRRGAPARTSEPPERMGTIDTRLATTRPAGIRFVPAGLAVLLALAAGAGALGRASDPAPGSEQVAAAPPPAPPSSTPAAPAPTAPATPPPPVATAAPAPPPAPAPTTARPAPRVAAAPAPARVAAPPTTRPTAPATTPPTTARPTTPTTRPPPAATAPTNPLAFTNWILQSIFQPPR
jgi:ABC-type multidrug transport system ATPase subunit